jgi:2-polyprenyl-6-methoxyphenol hydroxylase-like FAD-dependent oxidoreductase
MVNGDGKKRARCPKSKEIPDMSNKTNFSSYGGGHALVIGGSMAGLLAARVLADHVGRVTIVERDNFPEGPEFRKGVPQSRHTHVLMTRGRQILERLFPGLEDSLLEAGAVLIDSAEDLALLWPAGFAPRFRSGIPFLQSSRELLEFAARERVASVPNIRFLQKTDVTGLVPATQGEAVAGATVRSRGSGRGADEEILADLVVDASGRNSDASRWLEELGYDAPEETVVDAHLGYASRIYERTEGDARDWKALLVQAAPPDVTRGGVLYPIEGGRWIAGLDGVGGDYPPTDEEGFMQFARSLRIPMLYEAIKEAKPLSPIRGYRATKNVRRHYEKLSRQPHNFVVTGDAACAFNPVYGQGMTTAAIGAETLGETLREQDPAGLSGRFQRRLAKTTSAAWLLATGEDLRVRGVEGPPPDAATRLTNPYMDRVVELSLKDPAIYRTLLEVFHMTKPPTAMFGPSIAAKVLREALIGRGKNVLAMLLRLRPGSERDPKEAKAGSTDTETLGAANTG